MNQKLFGPHRAELFAQVMELLVDSILYIIPLEITRRILAKVREVNHTIVLAVVRPTQTVHCRLELGAHQIPQIFVRPFE